MGRSAGPAIGRALLKSVNAARADLVVVTGDLVQRAHRFHYRRAKDWLARVHAPLLVVPGNHDLYSWMYRPWMRITVPRGRYRRMVGSHVATTWHDPGVSVLGLDSATPWTIQRGRCTPAHVRRMRRHFGGCTAGVARVLAVHHPLVEVNPAFGRDLAKGAEEVALVAAHCGVDLLLFGHWHLSLACAIQVGGRQMVVSLAGTASSDRYRSPQEGVNAYHQIEVTRSDIVVEEWRFCRADAAFKAASRRTFARQRYG